MVVGSYENIFSLTEKDFMNPVKKDSLLASLSPEWPESLLPCIRERIRGSKYKIIILDDDPTGTQTVRDLPVLTDWSVTSLSDELVREFPAFFLLTNSRSIPPEKACKLATEIGQNLLAAEQQTGIRVIPISRSDSTLRGHFPDEVDSMALVMGKENLPYLVLPFFLEGGRYTVDDIHYVQEGDEFIPAAETPFARDAAFGFSNSNLRKWIEEKSRGKIKADQVVSITLGDIRSGGPARVAEILRNVPEGAACFSNCASYRDMEVVVAALLEVEQEGKEFLYRTAASFVRTRTGMDSRIETLRRESLVNQTTNSGGIFVIGSYVEKTCRQIELLFEQTKIKPIEIIVNRLLDSKERDLEIDRVSQEMNSALAQGEDVAVYTSRNLVTGTDGTESLHIGQTVSDSLIGVVKKLAVQPRYLVAKGGITSSDVATKGLGVKRAMVLGQPLPGVPAWQLGPETRFPGMTYIVFPGNVGSNDALVSLQRSLLCSQKEV